MGEEWQIRFAECPLPTCDRYGVSVTFTGTTPLEIEDLSNSRPI